MADWLCDVVTGAYSSDSPKAALQSCTSKLYNAPTYPQCASTPTTTSRNQIPHARSTIHPSPTTSIPEGFESAGAGRLVTFDQAQPLTTLIDHISHGTGHPGGIPIAIPQSKTVDSIHIRTVGLCPGSGSGVLLRNNQQIPDLLFTGEMSHHETLAATEQGSVVVSLAHSNSERGYLRAVMRGKLHEELSRSWQSLREDARGAMRDAAKEGGAEPGDGFVEVYEDAGVEVHVSEMDRDPYGIMLWKST